jgi:hypothetical protein
MARLRHGQEPATAGRRLRRYAGLGTSRAMVHLLRYLPGDSV